jgi:two-component system, OmpR family, heavy metal sensor histidine kinase CusS
VTMSWLPRSLTTRTTLLLGLIACGVTGALGAYFFLTAKNAITEHLDTQIIGRVEHFRRLVGNVQTIADLRDRPLLFEAMLGAESDVLLLRRPGESPFIDVNPNGLSVPAALVAVAADRTVAIGDILSLPTATGVPMHWVSALARAGRDDEMVEVVAGHPLTNEMKMIHANRDRVLLGASFAMLASTLLAYFVLRHGLRSLRHVAAQAALISPINLTARLPDRHAPREVLDMVVAFNAMLDRIAVGYSRLSQFSADLAHEIRTPVGALIGQTQVALNRVRSDVEYQHLLESNLEELNRLHHIAENILFLSRADHDGLSIEREPLKLSEELQKIAEYFEGPADENGLRFEVRASGVALVNADLCRRAVNNLVINAVRYGKPGTTVRLIGAQDEGVSTIAVENEGASVPPEQLDRLFDRFYRGDAARSRYTESNGLGLSIVKAIMTLHGGEARVCCPSSESIRFDLRFPC